MSREVVVERYRGTGPCEPVSSERTELVHLVEGSAELAQLDKLIAAAKATRAEACRVGQEGPLPAIQPEL